MRWAWCCCPPRPPGLFSGRSATLGAVPAREEGRELSHILSAWVSCSCARAHRAGAKGQSRATGSRLRRATGNGATGNGAGAPPHCRRRRARVHPAKAQAGRERDARPGRASTPSATAWHKARFAQLLAAACMRFACARVRARVCAALTWARVRARRAALEHHLSVPAPCIPRAAPRTLINLAASERSTR